MASAKKCDICGQYYEFYGKIPEENICFNTVILSQKQEVTARLVSKRIFDCCPECAIKIKKTIDKIGNKE